MSLDYGFLRPLADDLQRPVAPEGAPGDYRTFGMASPLATHFVPATCAEVDCPNYLNGWTVHVEGIEPAQLHAIRTSSYRYAEQHVCEGRTLLVFEPGQTCFYAGDHFRRLDREDRFYMRAGDYRAAGRVIEVCATAWVDEFGEHQERIAGQIERG